MLKHLFLFLPYSGEEKILGDELQKKWAFNKVKFTNLAYFNMCKATVYTRDQ